MYALRALAVAAALAALLPSTAVAQGRGPAQWALLAGLEDGEGDAGLQLRADLEFPQRALSPGVGFSIVGSIGYSRFHDEGTDFFFEEQWDATANILRFMGAARLSFATGSTLRPYVDGGIGLYYGSWSAEWQELNFPYASYEVDDSEVGLVLRLAAGLSLQVSPRFALGAELGFLPYLGDAADDATTSLLASATFRM